MAKSNVIQEKSYRFALKIVQLYRQLVFKHEYVLSKQMLKSGTSIGANVEEAIGAQSRADFDMKMTIAFKEARETHYWLRLFKDSQLLDIDYSPFLKDSDELIRILNAITRKMKSIKKISAVINS